MASYDATINLLVKGGSGLDRVTTRLSELASQVRRINATPIDLSRTTGRGANADALGVLQRRIQQLRDDYLELGEAQRRYSTGERTGNPVGGNATINQLKAQAELLEQVARNSKLASTQFREMTVAAALAAQKTNEAGRERLAVLSEAFTGGGNRSRMANVRGTASLEAVSNLLGAGATVPRSRAALSGYIQELRDLSDLLPFTSEEFREVNEQAARFTEILKSADLKGQVSAITPTAGPATRLSSESAFKQRAAYSKKVADLEYKQLLTGQQLVQAKLSETQQEQLQNRLAEASNALAAGELDIAQRLTNELRNQRILYERTNRAQERLMRPTSMVAGAAETITGRRPGGLPPVPGSPAAWQATGGVAAPEKIQRAKEQTVNSQKRLNNLLNSAQIVEQALLQSGAKGLDIKDEQARVQNVITKLQQLDVTATKAELAVYDDLLNLVRNELKLKKAIAAADATSAKAAKEKTKEDKKKKTEFGLSDAVIGGAFPLLFGQGAGASLGGALGGGLGAKFGGGKGGFGGSLVGTIVGQATIDFAVNSAVKLGQALQDPTERIDELIGFLGIAGTELNSNIKVLRALGLSSTASAAALAKLESALQKEGFKNAQEFSKDLQTLGNAFGRLQLAAANLAAGSLPGILDYLTEFIKRASEVGLPEGGGSAGRVAQVARGARPTKQQLIQANFIGPVPDPQSTAERVAQKAVSEEKQRQVGLAAAQKQLEADTLNLTRVDLATRQGAVSIQQVQNDLTRKQLEYKNETTKATQDLLGLEIQVLEQQKQQAIAAQRNAQIEAERQVQRQIGGLMIEQTELENQLLKLRSESSKLLNGEAAGLATSLNFLEARTNNELGILFVRRDLERLGVNEVEVLQEINTKYDGLAAEAQRRYEIEKLTLEQQLAQYNLTQLQIKQERDLAKVQAIGQAGLQLQQLRSFADPASIGFFGDAIINQKLALEEFSVALQLYDQQLLDLEERLAIPGINSDTRLALEQQKERLLDTVAVYKEYQPAIIQARLEQEKFNAVLNAVNPVVDNLFNSFTNLIAGTTSAKEAFASFLNSIADLLADTAKKMIAQYIAIGIARLFANVPGGPGGGFAPAGPLGAVGSVSTDVSSFFAPNANGNAFGANGIIPFAKGGIVDSPTLFPFAKGIGLMGEAGPEAILPLRRGADGKLGVMAAGGGGDVNVVVNVDAKGSSVEGNEQGASQLGRVISAAVQSELIKQQRPGGILAR